MSGPAASSSPAVGGPGALRGVLLGFASLIVLAPASARPGAAAPTRPAPVAPAPVRLTPAVIRLPDYRELRLPNGATLLLAERRDVPLVAFSAWLRGGSLADPSGKEGLANLTAALLRKGAGKRSGHDIAAALDGVGATLDAEAGLEVTTISGEFMARDQELLVELLADLLRRPAFPADEFEKLKARAADELIAAKDDPQEVIGEYAWGFFYGRHPYGRPESGDEVTLRAMTRQDVVDYYRAQYGGDRLTLAIVGDFSTPAMEKRLRRALADWPKAPGKAPDAPEPSSQTGRRVLLVDKPGAAQSYFWVGNLGIARKDPDRVALSIANTAYGGRYTSILNTALRIQSGLTYGSRWSMPRLTKAGTAALSSYTKTERTVQAVDLALETLARVRRQGLDSVVVEDAKAYLRGQYPPRLETDDLVAGLLAEISFYGLGRDEVERYLERVASATPEEVTRAMRRVYPPAEDLVFVFIGDASKIRSSVRRYGPVKEVSITVPLVEAVR